MDWTLWFTVLGLAISSYQAKEQHKFDIPTLCLESKPEDLLLERNHWYSYEAHFVGKTLIAGASDQYGKLDLKCSIKVQHSTQCVYTMEFQTCSVKASKGNEENRNSLVDHSEWAQFSEHPIRFTTSNGEAAVVYAHPADPIQFVNLKRGFISAIIIGNQPPGDDGVTHEKTHRDVQGHCTMETKTSGQTVKIRKDYESCEIPRKPQAQLSPFSTLWDMGFLKYMINSSLDCESHLEGQRLLRKMSCSETHTSRVDSSYYTKFGMKTVLQYEVELKGSGTAESEIGVQVDDLREAGIEYEHEVLSEDANEDPTIARDMLEDLIDEREVELESIPKFLELVVRMRHLGDLGELTQEAERCPGGETRCARRNRGIPLYLDALAHCNRLPCVQALREMHSRKLVSKSFLEFALFSWLRMPLTDHRYLNEFLEMCRSSQTRFCWLGLGGLVRTYSQSHTEIPDSVRQVINLVSGKIGASCSMNEVAFPIGTLTDQRTNYIITMLKSLRNMGKIILEVEPNIESKIFACAENHVLQTPARIVALQTLEELGPHFDPSILSRASSVLRNNSLPVDLRIAGYNLLMFTRENNPGLVTDLTDALQTDPSKQIKGFIASDIIQKRRKESSPFWRAFDDAIAETDVDLYGLAAQDPRTTSHVTLRESSTQLPEGLLPDVLNHFGHSLVTSTVFGGWSAIPQSITAKLNLTLFNKVLDFMEVGLQMTGLDRLLIRSKAALSDVQNMGNVNLMQYVALILQELRPPHKSSAIKKESVSNVLLNKAWEENLEKLYQSYQNSHAQQMSPHFMLYLRMLGIDLDYTTFPDIVGAIQRFLQDLNQRQKPSRGKQKQIPFSETHYLNFLEADHTFPSLMGAPLNWRANFTLVASLDASMDFNPALKKASVHFKPRLGSTVLGKMLLGIPGVTEMGMACKSSLFSATQFDLEASTETNRPIRFTVLPPKTKQRPLELYRHNYLVTENEMTELGDWDAERIDREDCLGEKFVKATGMKVCIKSSHLDVKHREDKPFYFLAGRAFMQLSAEMEDKGVEAYNMHVDFEGTTQDKLVVGITGDAKGSVLTRDIPLRISFDKVTGEFLLSLKHSDFPTFNFAVGRQRIIEADEHVGYKSSILLQDEGKQWDIIYTKSDRKEKRQDKPMTRNESPKDKNVESHIDERLITIKTPYNVYNFKLKLFRQPSTGNRKVDSLISSENFNQDHNWLKRILPEIFWESENKKAWLEFHGDWRLGHPSKKSQHKGHHGLQYETKSHLTIPATVIEVISRHIHKPKHTFHGFNVSKILKSSGELLLFANMTYNVWRKGKEVEPMNEIRTANLTLPRHSWSLEAHRLGNLHLGREGEETAKYVLTGEKMIPMNPEVDGNYIGWWSPSSASRFSSKRWQVTYQHNLKQKPVGEADLPEGSLNEIQDDLSSEENDGHSSEEDLMTLTSPGIRNQAIHADAQVTYPFGEKQENLTFNGVFQWNGRVSPAYRTFLKTFTVTSTLHSLQLDSQYLWTKAGNEKEIISEHFVIKDSEAQRDHGQYNLLFRKELQPGKCMGVLLNHTFSSHFFNFASHVSGTCKPENSRARLYDIEIHSNLPYWTELDFDLKQKFNFDMPGDESMNLTSPTMDIKVTGNWSPKMFHKTAEFNSKTDLMPSTVWEITADRERGIEDFIINSPNEEVEIFKSRREHKSKDQVEMVLEHKNKSNADFEEDARLVAKIINSNSILVNAHWKPQIDYYVLHWVESFIQNATYRLAHKLANPNHELNQNLKDHLKGKTIMQYLSGLQQEVSVSAAVVLRDLYEIARTFESFYGPSFQIVSNTVAEVQKGYQKAVYALSQTNLGWAWNYFEVNKYLNQYYKHDLVCGGEEERNITTVITHPFIWKTFNEKPTLDRRRLQKFLHLAYGKETPSNVPARRDSEHVAMIFGPSHVLTFDGRHYLFPDYPSDSCTVLLAQDVRGKTFSVLANKESMFVVFPDMAVTIDGSGRLYINTSTTESPTPVYSQNWKERVTRFGDIVRVESPYLRVDCDTLNEFCILLLNPLLSGGVIGLLGNADGERHNEFTGPGVAQISKASDLGAMYELSGEASCQNFVEHPPIPDEDAQATRRCNRLFRQEPVTHCLAAAGLKEEDLRPACVSDVYREGCPCATSKALAAFCAYEGYSLDRCQFQRRPEGAIPVPNQHDSWLVRGTHQLQLVFIVENYKYVMSGGSVQAIKGFETLLDNIEETFTSEGGYSTISYSLVVYGGDKGQEPHVVTQHRSSWMLQRDFFKSIRQVEFRGSIRGNPVPAVEFANSMITYEPSATRIIVLITVDDDVKSSRHGSKHIHSLQKQLENNGAALYVFASYPGLERGKKVFGLRADGLIFPNDAGDAFGEFPRSVAAKLAGGTRGSIFLRTHLEENKNQLFYESVAAEMLARVRRETGKCRQCMCTMSPWWQVQTHCKPAPAHLQNC